MPKGGLGGSGKIREALREELATGRTWTDFPPTPALAALGAENGLMHLKTYGDKLYGWQNHSGAVWEFNGKAWSISYQIPVAYKIANPLLGVCSSAVVFNGKLQIGTLQFDGSTWRTVTGLPTNCSIRSLTIFNNRLYTVVETSPDNRDLYVSDDGLNFSVIWTASAIQADAFGNLVVYKGSLYIGGIKAGAAPIYKFTGMGVPPTLVYTTTGNYIEFMDVVGGRLIVCSSLGYSGGFGYIYVYTEGPFTPTVWTATGYAFPRTLTRQSVEYKGARVVGTHIGGYCYALYDGGQQNTFIAVPIHRSSYAFTGFETYKGRLYMSHEGPNASEQNAASVWEFDGPPTQPIPAQYRLWTSQAVPAAATRTAALPTVGGRKTFMLISTVGGTLDIEVDPDGSGLGTYRIFTVPSETIVANVLWRYTTLDEFAWARLSFTPTDPATVQAWLNVVPE